MKNISPVSPRARTWRIDKVPAVLSLAALLALAACGGGSDGGGAPAAAGGGGQSTSASFSGTAAAGLPLVGSVTVKDAKGATRTVPLSSNGGYQVDVSDMTAPFVFRAQGTAGGQTYVIHSVATAADANGVINITTLTDLVVANIAGQLADKYFDGGNFAGLTKQEMDAEAAALRAKLLPVLLAMGVDSSVDLLRTSFTPLSSALDKALDVLRVSTDAATGIATITNIVTQQQITDDIAKKAASEPATTPMSGDGMGSAADDLTLIRKALSDFTAKFANGSPSPGDLMPLLTSTNSVTGTYDFLNGDQGGEAFATENASDPNLVGASFADVVFEKLDYTITSDNTSPRAYVDFTHKNKNGVAFSHLQNMQLVKGTDGVWRIRGDGRVFATATHVFSTKDNQTGCVTTGLQFYIEDTNAMNSSKVYAVVVKGPGLPAGGVTHFRPDSGFWPIQEGDGSNYHYLASNCEGLATASMSDSDIAAIPDGAQYTFTALDATGATAQFNNADIVYTDRIARRPQTLAEAKAAKYPAVSLSTPLEGYSGGNITVSATGLSPDFAAGIYLAVSGYQSFNTQVDEAPAKDGSVTKTLSLTLQEGGLTRDLNVTTLDSYWRQLTLRMHVQAPPP